MELDAATKELLDFAIQIAIENGIKELSCGQCNNCPSSDFIYSRLKHKMAEMEMDVARGLTKVVLIPNECDWVIKIPLFGVDNVDLCQKEVEIYSAAKEEHCESYFAASYFYKNVCGVPFYIQELCEVNSNDNDDLFYHYAENQYDIEGFDSKDAYLDAVSEYRYDMDAEEQIEAIFTGVYIDPRLFHLIDTWKLNDFHIANFGYRSGRPVLIDYSGCRG